MKRTLLIIYGLLVAALWAGPVAAQCLEYEPKVVSLSGALSRETQPGRPNYESVANGDEPETIWVLTLKTPICMLSANNINVGEKSETEIQLALDNEQYNKYRSLVGQSVTVTGKLFHGYTGHHHKRLLLRTNEIKKKA